MSVLVADSGQQETQKAEVLQMRDSQHPSAGNVQQPDIKLEQGNLSETIIQQPASEAPQEGDLPTDNIQQVNLPSSEQPDLQTSLKIEVPNNKVWELVTWCSFENFIGLLCVLTFIPFLIFSFVHKEVILLNFSKFVSLSKVFFFFYKEKS